MSSEGGAGDMLNLLSVRVQRSMSIWHSNNNFFTLLSVSIVTTDTDNMNHI